MNLVALVTCTVHTHRWKARAEKKGSEFMGANMETKRKKSRHDWIELRGREKTHLAMGEQSLKEKKGIWKWKMRYRFGVCGFYHQNGKKKCYGKNGMQMSWVKDRKKEFRKKE